MKIKNPIRTYLRWYGNECVAIADAPARQAIIRCGKFALKVSGIAVVAAGVTMGVVYGVQKLQEKLEERDS